MLNVARWILLISFVSCGIYFQLVVIQSASFSVPADPYMSEVYKTRALVFWPMSVAFCAIGILFFLCLRRKSESIPVSTEITTDHQLILNFRDFLLDSWPSYNKVLHQLDWGEDMDFFDDWLQANWELLVERQALGSSDLLVPYGDVSTTDYRYTRREETLTHRVICDVRGKEDIPHYFRCFDTKHKGFMWARPPFDLVCVENTKNQKIEYIQLSKINFRIVSIQ